MSGYSDLLKMRRSVRDYKERDIPLDVVLELIRESSLAPSSGNGQPWKFIVVTNREVIRILSDESKRNLLADIERDPDSPNRTYEALLRDEGFSLFYNAPCLVLIGGSKPFGRSMWTARLPPAISCSPLAKEASELAGSGWGGSFMTLTYER